MITVPANKKMLVFLSGAVLVLIHFLIYSRFLPPPGGHMGEDFGNYFPYFLDGYYWFRNNGLFATPWFTPSFCGGIPRFPNPVSIFYSVPQFLVFVVDPLTSARLTFISFSALGFWGFYLLLRKIYELSVPVAFTGGALFLFNDFFAHKFIMGHLTYHIFMLIPLVVFLIIRFPGEGGTFSRSRYLFDVTVTALLLAYMFYVDIAYVSAPTLFVILISLGIYGLIKDDIKITLVPLSKLLISGLLASAVYSAKLVAALSFLKHHDRDYYKLPGMDNLPDLFLLLFKSLFWAPQHELANDKLVNYQWLLQQHEFEFGITVVPLVFLIIGIFICLRDKHTGAHWKKPGKEQILILVLLTVLFALPALFNYYQPAWNSFLKQLPLFKSSSSLVRWFCVYVPVLILLASLAFERMRLTQGYRLVVVIASLAVIIYSAISPDRQHYYTQDYEPAAILSTYEEVRAGQWQPRISHVGFYTDKAGEIIRNSTRNNYLAHGVSQMYCYEAIFGYQLESLPVKNLQPGSVMDEKNGYLNFKNPACYVFPEENNCASGDHFRSDEREKLERLVTYKPFDLTMPLKQKAANLLSLATLLLLIVLLCINVVYGFIVKHKAEN